MGRQDDIMRAERARTGNYGQDWEEDLEEDLEEDYIEPCPVCGSKKYKWLGFDKYDNEVGCDICMTLKDA